jgi:membrane-associated protease RseP (regulator of RpoE activity)
MRPEPVSRLWPPPADAATPPAAARVRRRRLPVLNIGLFALTLVTMTIVGASYAGVSADELRDRWTSGLPFSLTLMSILLAHEMGHYVLARIHGMPVTLPFFLPGIPLAPLPGTFGALIRMRALPANRRVLFDVGAAGPWAGFALAVPAAIYGLHLSEVHPVPPSLSAVEFGDCMLFKMLSRIMIGPIPHGFDVVLHPIALAGWFGLLVTVLNLLPVGQLDGGHVVYAMFGRRHRWIARGFLAFTVAVGFRGWQGWFFWAVLMVLIGLDHPPTLDAATVLDPRRRIAGWLTCALFVATFIPVPIRLIEGGHGPRPEELIPAISWFLG